MNALSPIYGLFWYKFVVKTIAYFGPTPICAHVLRVYLIDSNKRIRNIYSVSFLLPDIIVNDIKTIIRNTIAHRSR